MRVAFSFRWGAVVLAVGLVAFGSSGALAQQHRYQTGAVPTPVERLQSIPETAIYRDFLPAAVDLSKYFPPVGDQGEEGSCVGWATAYAARAYYARQVEHRDTTQPDAIPSPAWVYNNIRDGAPGDCTVGTLLPDALDLLMGGALSLAQYPYDDGVCAAPDPKLAEQISDFHIAGYERIDPTDLDQVKGELAQGNPVVVIAVLDNAFFDLKGKTLRGVWHSDYNDPNVGGHAFTIVGYDDATRLIKFINSWSTEWGDEGYGRMDYDTFQIRVVEAYVMQMEGDPDLPLAAADMVADKVDLTPLPPSLIPPGVRPVVGLRELGETPVDLGDLQCGKVDVTTDADGTKIATGFVGTEAELERVSGLLGASIERNDIEVAPWPRCEVMLTLSSQLADTDTPVVQLAPEAPKLGDDIAIAVRTPGFASYVYAAYFSADGTVSTIAQPNSDDLFASAPHSDLSYGDTDAGQRSLKIDAPVGDEMLLVVNSETPLFPAALPQSLTDRQFLSALREAVLADQSGRVTATLLPVTTTE